METVNVNESAVFIFFELKVSSNSGSFPGIKTKVAQSIKMEVNLRKMRLPLKTKQSLIGVDL